jgi:hypothetical protein
MTTVFSSWGPTDDGRIKPDIVANGEWLLSTTLALKPSGQPDNFAYDRFEGTSMATPVVTGIGALLAQLYRQEYQNSTTDHVIRADEMRAVLIHTADDGTRDQHSTATAGHRIGPSYCIGWGSVNALLAAATIRGVETLNGTAIDPTFLLFRVPVTGQTFSKKMKTSTAARNFGVRVTLAWIDEDAGEDNSDTVDRPDSGKLVHDLNMTISSPAETKFFPWTLDPSHPARDANRCRVAKSQSVPAGCQNVRDNVEVIDIDPAQVESGTWTIDITIPDGMRGRHFALATYGLRSE